MTGPWAKAAVPCPCAALPAGPSSLDSHRPSADGQAGDADHSPTADVLHSKQLMQGRNAISILHNGAVYRLQATRLGKLILTK